MRKSFTIVLLGALIFNSCLGIPATMIQAETIEGNVAQQEETNLEDRVKNGTFDNGFTFWTNFYAAGGEGEFTNDHQALTAKITNIGTEVYGVGGNSNIFTLLKNGKYRLEYEISSTIPRQINCSIQMSGAPYTGYYLETVDVDTTPKKIVSEFTMEGENDQLACIAFQMGKISETTPNVPHDVTIDNVHLYVVDESECSGQGGAAEEKKIAINQLGYRPDDKKIAVFAGDINGAGFDVINADTNEVVYSGNLYGKRSDMATAQINCFADFTVVTTPGKYKIVLHTEGETKDPAYESYTFEIGENIYDNVFKDTMRFFYLQRCGEELSSSQAGDFSHPKCHTTLGKIYGTNETIDVSGGWHDAGDYGRYVVATAATIGSLLNAYQDKPAAFDDNFNIPESNNGQSDLLDEVKLELDWLLKMQAPNGGVYHKATCANFPGFVMPQEETAEIIVCPVTTTATGDFAAVMAMGYDNFKDTDPVYAKKCLDAAEKAWDYLAAQPEGGAGPNLPGIESGSYEDSRDHDERYWAAAQLFKATGNPKYDKAVHELAKTGILNGYDWSNVDTFGNIAYMQAEGADQTLVGNIKNAVLDNANKIVAMAKNDSYGVSMETEYHWGSNGIVASHAVLLCLANDIAPNSEYIDLAKEHINYLFGKNGNAASYVTGYGEKSPVHPHHRPSAAQHKAVPGMLAGGPNKDLQDPVVAALRGDAAPAKCYIDELESYSTNEVDIYWNAPFVYALAKLTK